VIAISWKPTSLMSVSGDGADLGGMSLPAMREPRTTGLEAKPCAAAIWAPTDQQGIAHMAKDFVGKRVIVMGGSRGIGRAIALGFAAQGAAVSICARNPGPLEATRREIAALGVTAHGSSVDLADAKAIEAYVPQAVAALGGLDVLVNNASGFGHADDEEGWAASLNVDMMAIVRGSHAAVPHMKPGSSIVNISRSRRCGPPPARRPMARSRRP
jgi:NAD(P)-dependent dehydrogenase (short-subunit alcohol dehydrogenase family)